MFWLLVLQFWERGNRKDGNRFCEGFIHQIFLVVFKALIHQIIVFPLVVILNILLMGD